MNNSQPSLYHINIHTEDAPFSDVLGELLQFCDDLKKRGTSGIDMMFRDVELKDHSVVATDFTHYIDRFEVYRAVNKYAQNDCVTDNIIERLDTMFPAKHFPNNEIPYTHSLFYIVRELADDHREVIFH